MGIHCPLCGLEGIPVTLPFEGYIKGWTTTICECTICHLSFSSRRDVPSDLYDNIYRQAKQVVGYSRYDGYAKDIGRQSDPARWLAEREAPYRLAMEWLDRQPRDRTVLEIGSGLGYLTHALRHRGTPAVGVDLSMDAVSSARERFNDAEGFFLPEEINTRYPDGFDVVVGLEIVEHVPDPLGFIREAMGYLKPKGTLVLTTPNRDAFTSETLWDSDTPPVHLTWFGSLSMKVLADAVSADLEVIEAGHDASLPTGGSNETMQSVLSETGQVTQASRNWSSPTRRRIDNAVTKATRTLHQGRQRLPGLPRPWLTPPSSITLGVALTRR